jgi:arylsulfatase A-like enzyme
MSKNQLLNDNAMKKRHLVIFILPLISLLLLGFTGDTQQEEGQAQKPNILFISVDDLRPAIGAYGDPIAKTPNIDRLASEGRVFNRHYVYYPACGPSRAALLSGRRTGLQWDIWEDHRQLSQEPETPVSMPDHFQRNGYSTVSIGKISHRPAGRIPRTNIQHEVPFSWDIATGPTGQWGTPWRAFFGYAGGQSYNAVINEVRNEPPRLPFEKADVSDTGYPDGLIANTAVEQLENLAKSKNPFFLGVGFFKPHLPHNAPARYWNMYSEEEIGFAEHRKIAHGADPEISVHPSYEVTTHYHWPWGEGNISRELEINQRWAYYACVSYIDAQIGKVIDALEKNGLAQNTIIVLWGDHGWHLGEQGMFGKQTLYETATRSPLIINTPNINAPGEHTDGIVETIDIYPTLTELAGLPQPGEIDGRSLAPMVRDPNSPGNDRAFSIFRGTFGRDGGSYKGKAVRTDRYRYIEWRDYNTDEVHHRELYDFKVDPDETINIAKENPELVTEFSKILQSKDLNFE